MSYFRRKAHLFTRSLTTAAPTTVGIIRSQAARHMGIQSTLLACNSDLSSVCALFQYHRILTGTYSAAVAMSHTSQPDGGMDEGLGVSLTVTIGGTDNLDASYDVLSPNEDAQTLLYLVGDEIPPTSRVHPGSGPTNRKILRARGEATPSSGWSDLLSLPLVAGKCMAIRGTLHANEGGSIGSARWLVVAKNVGGTVTIVGDNLNASNTFCDFATNYYAITTRPRAYAGTNAVKLQCYGNSGSVVYSAFVDSAVTL